METQKETATRISLLDLVVATLINAIGGFAVLYLFVIVILPEYDSWQIATATIIFVFCMLHVQIKILLLALKKNKNENLDR